MELKLGILVLILFSFCIPHSEAIDFYPHGEAKILVEIIRNGDIAEFRGNRDFMEETFSHPQVKDRKIVVFSIIGAYREGKSFFLDYCLRYLYATYESVNSTLIPPSNENWIGEPNEPLSGFSWKHGSKADTKGLMMWSDVFLYNAPNGEKIAIVIIDTQGLFNPESSDEENSKIFGFTTLISSIQIINIKQTMKENQIAYFQAAIEQSNFIMNRDEQQNSSKFFQDLIFLLRDFNDAEFGFEYEGGQKYLNEFFQTSGTAKSSVNRNIIRDSFHKISCFLLNHPGLVVKRKTFKGEWSQLNPLFVKNLNTFIESLLKPENLVPKKSVLKIEQTSEMFKDFTFTLIELFNTRKLPEVKNKFETAVANEIHEATKMQVKKYKESWENEMIDFNKSDFDDWLNKKHQEFKNRAVVELMSDERVKTQLSKEKIKKVLEDEIDKFFKPFAKKTVQAYTAFNTEKEMRAILNEKVSQFRTIIIEGINFELENFEEFIDKKHQNLSNIFLLNFVESTQNFDDEVRQNKFKATLQDEIAKSFKSWKDWAMKHNQDVRIQGLVKIKLETYRQRIENESDFNRENFEAHIDQKHLEFKEETLLQFSEETSKFSDHQLVEKFQIKLAEEIETFFDSWKNSKLRDYKKFSIVHNQQVQTKLAADIQNFTYIYEDEMNLDLDLNHQNFAFYLDQRHREIKNQVIQQFLDASKGFGSQILKEFNERLEAAVEQKFKDWKPKKVQEQKQHQQKQEEMLEREMLILINNYAIKYEELMVKNLSLDQKDFEYFIDEKHRTVEQTILSEFSSKAPSSDASFVNELKVKIAKIFKDFRQKKINERKLYLEQKQELIKVLIEKEMLNKVSEYKEAMDMNLDYNQDDFEELLYIKHEEQKKKTVQKFLNIQEISELENQHKNQVIRVLKEKINNAFAFLRPLKIEYYQVKKEKKDKNAETDLQILVATMIDAYERNFLASVNYESEQFESQIRISHEQCRKDAVKDFNDESKKINLPSKVFMYKTQLDTEIQTFYNEWKVNAIESNKIIVAKKKDKSKFEMEEISRNILIQTMKKIPDWKSSEIFQNSIQRNIKKEVNQGMEKFENQTDKYKEIKLKEQISNKLRDDLTKHFNNLAISKVEKEIKKEQTTKLELFKGELEEILLEQENFSDFEIRANIIYSFAKERILNEFLSDVTNVQGELITQQWVDELKNMMEQTFEGFLESRRTEYKKLESVGIWIPWNTTSGYPRNHALNAGTYKNEVCAVVRFDGYIGEYCKALNHATANVNDVVRTSETFEILLFTNWEKRHKEYSKNTLLIDGRELCCVEDHHSTRIGVVQEKRNTKKCFYVHEERPYELNDPECLIRRKQKRAYT